MILRKRKRDIIDQAYGRYTYNDPVLPDWFKDDDGQHTVPTLPMTREMADDIKARQREINARPIKKVIEAKNRIKRKAAREQKKLTLKATQINDSTQLSESEKAAQIQALFKKAKLKAGTGHKKPEVVVARKGKGAKNMSKSKSGGQYKMVDKRLKSDLAAQKRRNRKNRKR